MVFFLGQNLQNSNFYFMVIKSSNYFLSWEKLKISLF
jgi:hypothetical protein